MSISLEAIQELRRRTSVGMMACKKALEESNGDMESAIEILRKRGEMKAAEKADRSTGEGAIALSGRAMVRLGCETDFVAKNEAFVAFVQSVALKADQEGAEAAKAYFEASRSDQVLALGENITLGEIEVVSGGTTFGGYLHSNAKLAAIVVLEGGTAEQAKDVAMHAVAMNPLVANPSDVPSEVLEKERAIYREQLKNEGKPEQIWEKIVEGKISKFCAEQALTSQPFVKNPEQTVQQYLGDAKLLKFVRLSV